MHTPTSEWGGGGGGIKGVDVNPGLMDYELDCRLSIGLICTSLMAISYHKLLEIGLNLQARAKA